MSSWLITGGAGFIGTNFVRLVASRTRHDLVVLDDLTYAGNIANIADLVNSDRVKLIRGDICNASLLTQLFEHHNVDRVVHFAAESHVDRSILGPDAFLKTNVTGTYTLLEAARDAWVNSTKEYNDKLFLHVSTDEVYGSLSPTYPPFNENSPYQPNSPYSASKASSDHLVRAWHHTYGLPTIVTNCSNNYGPWQFPEKLIPLMVLNAYEGRELPVYGDGLQSRDWLHVADHCEALLLVLDQGQPGETYLIGGGDECTNIELVKRICTIIDEYKGKSYGDALNLIRYVNDRPGHDRRYAINTSKIRALLGWRPQHSLDQSLPEVARWYLHHQDWTASIRTGEYMEFYHRQYGTR